VAQPSGERCEFQLRGSFNEAWAQAVVAKPVLEEAAKLFPADSTIQYNLACYSAQLGQLDAAQEYLDKSYELGDAKQIKLMALDDDDLKPLWESEAK